MRRLTVLFALGLLVYLTASCGAPQTTHPQAKQEAPAQATSVPPSSEAPKPAAPQAQPAAPTQSSAPAAKSSGASVIRINIGTYPDNLDPQQMSFLNEIQHASLIYEGLLNLDTNLKPIPGAAEKWDVLDGGKTYRFTLRKGLKYSDGQPLSAKNFEYAFKRAADPLLGGQYQSSTYDIEGAEAYGTADPKTTAPEKLKELRDKMAVKALDDTTLEIRLAKPVAYFPYIAYQWFGFPVREDMVAKGETWWADARNQIGNGPFIMTELKEKELARFVPNPNWHGEKPQVDEIQFRYITESRVYTEAYKNGEFDIILLAAEELETAQKDPVLSKEIVRYPGSCTQALFFNMTRAPFDKKDVRLAFAKGIDREAYVRDILRGLGVVTTAWMPPGIPGYNKDAGANLKYDPAAGKAAWQRAGYSGEVKLTHASTSRIKTRFEFIAGQLQQNLGFTPVLDPVEPTTLTALQKNIETNPPVTLSGWCADYPDPQNWLTAYWRSTAYARRYGYKNADLDKLMDAADVEQNADKRYQMYQQAEKTLLDDVVVSPMYNTENAFLVKPYVQYAKTTSHDLSFPGSFEPWKLAIKK
ncbi:MAG: peptide ABC transporter substrate-binding protein [Anaerolineae bacterium]|nr:peptide ABC transporter substrate-binding protein [Anaerolineae bacterium]